MAKTEKEPLEVSLVRKPEKNPYEGKFPYWNEVDSVPKMKVKFHHVQQPNMLIEFTKGRTVIKANGRLGTIHERYKIDDGEVLELPNDVVEHLNSLVYPEGGQMKPRFMLVPAA